MANGFLLDDDDEAMQDLPDASTMQDLPSPTELTRQQNLMQKLQEIRNQESEGIDQEISDNVDELQANLPPEEQMLQAQQQSIPEISPMERYQALLKQRQDAMRNLGLLRASQQIGQAFAGQYSGQFKPDTSGVDALEKQANLPVDDYALQQKIEKAGTGLIDDKKLRDPKSTISQFYRNTAKKRGLEVTDDMSAFDIGQMMKSMGRPSDARAQAMSLIDPKTGQTFLGYWDPATKSYYNDQGQPVQGAVRAYATQFRETPTGDINAFQPGLPTGAPKVVLPSTYTPGTELPKEQVKTFKPNKEQRTAIDKEQGRVDDHTKIARSQVTAISKLRKVLAQNGPLTSAVVRTQMPRLSGEVGNLNESEQAVWTGSKALLDRIEQWFTGNVTGELTDDNRKYLNNLINEYDKSIRETLNMVGQGAAKRLSNNVGVPPTYSLKGLDLPDPDLDKKRIVKKGYNPKTNQTQFIYSNGSKEIVDGQR